MYVCMYVCMYVRSFIKHWKAATDEGGEDKCEKEKNCFSGSAPSANLSVKSRF